MPVRFEFRFDKAKAVLLYFAGQSLPEFTKGKACKLFFLADKRHLVRYGRPITGDSYAAMQHGPIPSHMLDILDEVEKRNPHTREAREIAAALQVDTAFQYPRFRPVERAQIHSLSDSDVEVLNEIVREYGRCPFTVLRRITHDMPAYEKVWESPERTAGSVPMLFEDFFEEDDDAMAGVLEDMVENNALHEAFPEPAWL